MRAKTGSEDRRAAEAEIAQLERRLAGSRSAVSARGSALVGLVQGDAWPHARLVGLLRAQRGVTFVSYYPARRQLLAWVLRGERLELRRVPIGRDKLEATVAELRQRLVRFHPPGGSARGLYDRLIGEVFPGGVPKRLVVVPAGALQLLPFAALHDGRDYLVARTTLSQLSSINALRALSPNPTPPKGPDGRPAVSFARQEAPASAGEGVVRLPFVMHEAAAFGRAFAGARLFSGPAADAAELLRSAPGARLLHLATHAVYQPDAPLRSHLALADGPFELSRVFGIRLSAELVVLSGCETGLGPLAGADGILGLHSAFLTAGARRVVSSLWRVSDLGTALLMKHFFRRMAAGDPPALALRRAQNVVRRRLPHPAFWSGFRLDGQP